MKAKLVDGILYTLDDAQKLQDITKRRDVALIQNNVSDEVINAILSKRDDERSASELLKIVMRKEINDEYQRQSAEIDSYLPLVEEEYFGAQPNEHQSLFPQYREEDGKIIKSYVLKEDILKARQEIARLKNVLSESDYKVIKMYEASLLSEKMPYDIDEVTSERQKIRDKINELEALI